MTESDLANKLLDALPEFSASIRTDERRRLREGAVERVLDMLDMWDEGESPEIVAQAIVDAILGEGGGTP